MVKLQGVSQCSLLTLLSSTLLSSRRTALRLHGDTLLSVLSRAVSYREQCTREQ